MKSPGDQSRIRVIAVASAGGHWIQLLRLAPAIEGHDVIYISTDAKVRHQVAGSPFIVVRDASRWTKISLIRLAAQMAWIIARFRPDVVISTGAAPGLFAVICGKLFGARTAWIDSIANAESLSMSGRIAGRFADLWLTQWQHLAKANGPMYAGSVL